MSHQPVEDFLPLVQPRGLEGSTCGPGTTSCRRRRAAGLSREEGRRVTPFVRTLAARQLADYRAGTPGMWFAERDRPELSVEDAYAVQSAVVAMRSRPSRWPATRSAAPDRGRACSSGWTGRSAGPCSPASSTVRRGAVLRGLRGAGRRGGAGGAARRRRADRTGAAGVAWSGGEPLPGRLTVEVDGEVVDEGPMAASRAARRARSSGCDGTLRRTACPSDPGSSS
jgi:hypothetical protein